MGRTSRRSGGPPPLAGRRTGAFPCGSPRSPRRTDVPHRFATPGGDDGLRLARPGRDHLRRGAQTPGASGAGAASPGAGGVWRALDWRNYYYIATDRRVVWLEKVIGIYDNRQESPLRMILSVAVSSGLLGRPLGDGGVAVRPYTGAITL